MSRLARPRARNSVVAALGLTAAAALVAGALSGRDESPPSHRTASRLAPHGAAKPHVRLRVRRGANLPAAVQDPATAALGGSLVLAGGLDSADVSTGTIVRVRGRVASQAGTLPAPVHDAAAATVGGATYLFGGGEPSSAAIVRVAPGSARRVGTLPAPASDVGAATLAGTAYVVGGYTGTTSLDTIVAWRPGAPARVVGHLPVGLRYAGVTTAGGRLIVAGGTAGTTATRAVYSFDPATRRVTRIARLPQPLTHAAAAAVGSTVYIAGGRGALQGTQVRAVLALDLANGRIRRAGRLPRAASDMGAAVIGGRILLAGGRDSGGAVLSRVLEVTP